MKLTVRDVRLLRDLALSHVLSRDQLLALNYFGSVTRANNRLRSLRAEGLVRKIETPFFGQGLYGAGVKAVSVVGDRIGQLLAGRTGSPRFLQHALAVTNCRICLTADGSSWRFEQQATEDFQFLGKAVEVRPDGLMVKTDRVTAVEVDLGHVSPAKFREKLISYDRFVLSRECERRWGSSSLKVLVVTTGKLRASRLLRLAPKEKTFDYVCVPHEALGISFPGAWS